jgi:hypothetical protein
MKMDKRRSAPVIRWIEKHCRIPSGPHKGWSVLLTIAQQQTIHQIYDAPDAPCSVPVTEDRELAAYLALVHLASHEATLKTPVPPLNVDPWTVWNASDSSTLRPVLKREPDAVVCPELGTRFPRAA